MKILELVNGWQFPFRSQRHYDSVARRKAGEIEVLVDNLLA